jgi:aminoglycoside/choline kinase family phosphotransferase
MLKNDARLSLIQSWLTQDLGWRIGRITVASADASFRRYFRVSRGDVDPAAWAPKADTLIVMDAPPGKEDIAPYLKVTSLLEQAGAHVPHVHAHDARRGFVVMEDLGSTQYLSVLRTGRGVDKLYGDALTTLANIQVRGLRAAQQLAPYDREPLERELELMPEWFLRKHLGLELTPEERAMITVTNEVLINEATVQPQVFVHRDFHSRNLMVLPPNVQQDRGPGVIDFQDALRGPIGYDLVSLLKDCYISWSRERVERWVKGYRRVLGGLGANVGDSEYQFLRWFDFIGVQRHIKVLGIFARLWHRDGKIGYLDDLPLVMHYVLDACGRYPELVEFGRWLQWRVAPQLPAANARQKERAARQAAVHAERAHRRVKKKRKATSPRRKAKLSRKMKPSRKVKRAGRKTASRRVARPLKRASASRKRARPAQKRVAARRKRVSPVRNRAKPARKRVKSARTHNLVRTRRVGRRKPR